MKKKEPKLTEELINKILVDDINNKLPKLLLNIKKFQKRFGLLKKKKNV